jgi:hypothetical protein
MTPAAATATTRAGQRAPLPGGRDVGDGHDPRVIDVAVIEDPAAAEARVTRRARLLARLAEPRSAL